MDKSQRDMLRGAVGQARRLLEQELQDQLEGSYNILPDGRILESAPGDPIVRARLLGVIEHHRAGGASPAEAIQRTLREAAFTVLNRFAALKMAERRGLVRFAHAYAPLDEALARAVVDLSGRGYCAYSAPPEIAPPASTTATLASRFGRAGSLLRISVRPKPSAPPGSRFQNAASAGWGPELESPALAQGYGRRLRPLQRVTVRSPRSVTPGRTGCGPSSSSRMCWR